MGNAKKTILQILPALNTGGVERGTVDLAAALVKQGYRALVASAGGSLEKELVAAGAEHIQLPFVEKNPTTIYKNIARIETVVRQYEVDLLHARSRAPCWSAYFACKNLRIPFVTTCHGCHSFGFLKLKKMYNQSVLKGDVVIAISDFIKQYLVDNYSCNEEKIHVIHRGVEPRYVEQLIDKSQQENFKAQWDIPGGRQLVILPSRLSRWKGQLTFVEAIAILPKENRPYCLVMGKEKNAAYLKELKDKIHELGLEGDVRCVGNVKNLLSIYPLADVVVAASIKPEPFGRIPIEAAAMGCVVIAADHGGAQETIIPNETGFLVPPRDSMALAEMLTYVLTLSDAEKKHIGSVARKRVLEKFTLEKMSSSVIDIYEELLSASKGAATV